MQEDCKHGETRASFDGNLSICASCGRITHALNDRGQRELDGLRRRSDDIAARAFRKMLKEMGFENGA